MRRISRWKEFRFLWVDAWNKIDCGYDTILQTTESGKVYLQCLVNGEPQCIELTDQEENLICLLEQCNLKSWDKKEYNNYNYEDGTRWKLAIAYDNVAVKAMGMNGYPREFERFLGILIDTLGMRKSDIYKGNIKKLEKDIRNTQVEEMNGYSESISTYSKCF